MQLQLHTPGEGYVIQSAGPGWVRIEDAQYESSLLLGPGILDSDWPVSTVESLNAAVAEQLLAQAPELVLLGTGSRLVFPNRDFLSSFHRMGIGCEVMDTLAACRTYNVLLSEGRSVLAALILERSSGA